MSVIGTFTPSKEGGWIGTIHTLTMNTKVRLVPNDNRDNENAPAFRVFVGRSRVGDAWEARSSGDSPKDYLRVRLDDPSLPEPISAALFQSDDGSAAQLVWNRRRTTDERALGVGMTGDNDRSQGHGMPTPANDNGRRPTGGEDPRILRIAEAVGRKLRGITSSGYRPPMIMSRAAAPIPSRLMIPAHRISVVVPDDEGKGERACISDGSIT